MAGCIQNADVKIEGKHKITDEATSEEIVPNVMENGGAKRDAPPIDDLSTA